MLVACLVLCRSQRDKKSVTDIFWLVTRIKLSSFKICLICETVCTVFFLQYMKHCNHCPSRQRYVLGDGAMKRMAKASVLLYGMGGLGIEIGR
jgi:hypothetical protein